MLSIENGNIVSTGKFWIGFVSMIVFGVLSFFEGILKNVYTFFTELSEIHDKSINELKSDLSNALKGLEQPILIILDDVDRLTPDEVKNLLQLVKANADFPNVIYLLLFQRDILEKAIDKYSGQNGRDFLEKIIQIGFNIPATDRGKLEGVLFERLDQMLSAPAIDVKFQKQRWQEIFIPGIRPFFNNMRDVNRFTGTLSFHIDCFKSENSFEVNPVDLIAIEVLRVFEPEVYKAIPSSREYLTGEVPDAQKHQYKQVFTSILEAGNPENKKAIEAILSVLFSNFSNMISESLFDEHDEGSFKSSMISHPDIFDRYFYFKTPSGDIPTSEIEGLLALSNDREKFYSRLSLYKKQKKLKTVLDRINYYAEDISLEHFDAFVTAIFDIGDNLPEEEAFSIGEISHISRILRQYILKEPDVEKRSTQLINCIQNTFGLYIPFHIVHSEVHRHESKKSPHRYLVEDKEIEALKGCCLFKMESIKDPKVILSNNKCFYLLFLWNTWCNDDKARVFIEEAAKDNHSFGKIVFSACHTVVSSVGATVTRRLELDLKSLMLLLPLDIIRAKAAEIDMDTLDTEGKLGIDTLKLTLARLDSGETEEQF